MNQVADLCRDFIFFFQFLQHIHNSASSIQIRRRRIDSNDAVSASITQPLENRHSDAVGIIAGMVRLEPAGQNPLLSQRRVAVGDISDLSRSIH